jgi:4-amino-4-deoxy-L-arabinose transferase-like glycosyltransferase
VPSTGVAAGRLTSSLRPRSSLLAGIFAALWAATLVPLISVGSSSERLVEAFATDEALQLNLLHSAAVKHTFALTFGPYGHLVFNLILLTLRAIPGELSDPRIIHTGRSISVLFAAATLYLTFVWARRAFGVAAAWIAFSALMVNATLYTWAVVLKPDMVQLFLLMLALALTCRLAEEPRLGWLALASSAAGLAFACKYSGLFVLPIIAAVAVWRPAVSGRPGARVLALRWLAAALAIVLIAGSFLLNLEWIALHLTEDGRVSAAISPHALMLLSTAARVGALALGIVSAVPWFWTALRRSPRALAGSWAWLVAASAFAVSFIVASPYSLRKAAFLKGLLAEASDAAAPPTLSWLALWMRAVATVVEWPVLCAALATMAGLLWMACRPRARVNPSDAILFAWIALYAAVLLAPVHEFYVQYALPIVPPAAMLAGRGSVAAVRWLTDRAPARRRLFAGVLGLIVFGLEVPMAQRLFAARKELATREETSAVVQAGKWIGCRAPTSARIAYDYFSYIPPAFPSATPTWGGSRAWLVSLNPDIVVVNAVTAGAAMSEPEHAAYYQCLASGSCGYARVLSRGEITVYGKQQRLEELFGSTGGVSARRCS